MKENNYVEAPREWRGNGPSVFLAGTITGAKDWQEKATQIIHATTPEVAVLNPRRKSFDVKDASAADVQIEWEHRHLKKAEEIIFWFDEEGISAITFFELGRWLPTNKVRLIGCHPKFWRAFDVSKQVSLERPDLSVFDNFDSMMAEYVNIFTAPK
jgi:hypothetical protein